MIVWSYTPVRKVAMSRLIVTALVALYAAGASAQMYRWVDKDGRVHYTDTPPASAAAKDVQKKSNTPSVIETSQVPYAVQQAAQNFPVTIYTSENCGAPCKDARTLLAQRAVPFREVAVADDKSREELKRLSGGDTVPVMTVGRSPTRGFAADTWHNALDAAGYPRSAPQTAQAKKPAPPAPAAPKPAEEQPAQPRGPYAPR